MLAIESFFGGEIRQAQGNAGRKVLKKPEGRIRTFKTGGE